MALKDNLKKFLGQKRESGWIDLPITANKSPNSGLEGNSDRREQEEKETGSDKRMIVHKP